MDDAGNNAGLPNLPALSRFWTVSETPVVIAAGVWTQVADGDLNRWSIGFAAGAGGSFLISTVQDPFFQNGIVVGFNGFIELKFKDWGPLVQQPWFACDLGGRAECQVFTAGIKIIARPQVAGSDNVP